MTILIIVIVLALLFEYINGFHDAANAIATVVSTKALTLVQAVIWAAFFNAIVLFLCQHKLLGFEFRVADTITKIVKTEAITLQVILSGLIAAIFWNLLTWWKGIPSSSSHTLIGGFAGAAIAKAGLGVLSDLWKIYMTIGFIFLAPIIGMALAYVFTIIILNLCRNSSPGKVNLVLKRLQLVSSAAFSIGYGANDAQKVMGIIVAALLVFSHTASPEEYSKYSWTHVHESYKIDTSYYALDASLLSPDILNGEEVYLVSKNIFKKKGLSSSLSQVGIKANALSNLTKEENEDLYYAPKQAFVPVTSLSPKKDIADIPVWVEYSCFFAIILGILSGGKRIIKTMGTRITKVTPLEGVAAESAGAVALYVTQFLGIPVSTTHTITGAIVGVGAVKRISAVRWGVTSNLLTAWILTIPISGLIAAITYWLVALIL